MTLKKSLTSYLISSRWYNLEWWFRRMNCTRYLIIFLWAVIPFNKSASGYWWLIYSLKLSILYPALAWEKKIIRTGMWRMPDSRTPHWPVSTVQNALDGRTRSESNHPLKFKCEPSWSAFSSCRHRIINTGSRGLLTVLEYAPHRPRLW